MIRSCKKLGIKTVAVHSDVDADAVRAFEAWLFVGEGIEAVSLLFFAYMSCLFHSAHVNPSVVLQPHVHTNAHTPRTRTHTHTHTNAQTNKQKHTHTHTQTTHTHTNTHTYA